MLYLMDFSCTSPPPSVIYFKIGPINDRFRRKFGVTSFYYYFNQNFYVNVFIFYADIWGFKTSLEQKSRRPKRWVGVALSVGRALFSGAVRRGVTRSGARLTRHYAKSGIYIHVTTRNQVFTYTSLREIRYLHTRHYAKPGICIHVSTRNQVFTYTSLLET